MIILISKKKILILIFVILFIISLFSILKYISNTSSIIYHEKVIDVLYEYIPTMTNISDNEEVRGVLKDLFYKRNIAILGQDKELLESLYDKNIKYSLWAFEHEIKKMKYLRQWADKQGIQFSEIDTFTKVRSIKGNGNKLRINLIGSTEYKYFYQGETKKNMMRIGTYHSMDIEKREEKWVIVKEWYTDPFADSLNLRQVKSEEITKYILNQKSRELTTNQRRLNALDYMDRYCGAAADEKFEFKYNSKYRNYNPLGGDCANFASQSLHEGGKFKKTLSWNYDKGGATKAWINAHGFKNYMLNSGRASKVAYGSYEQVHKAAYKLLPGDFVAYEKKGKVTHISVVSGSDSKGYTLVNSHNSDRYRVPWDLGWSNKGIKFWLIHVHF